MLGREERRERRGDVIFYYKGVTDG